MVKKWWLFASLLAVVLIVPASAQAQVGIYNPRTNYFYRSSGGGNPGFGGWQGGGAYQTGGGWIGPAGYTGSVGQYSFGTYGYTNPNPVTTYVIPGWGASSTGSSAPRMRDSLMPAVGVAYNSPLLLTNIGNAGFESGSSYIRGASFNPGATATVGDQAPLMPVVPGVVLQPGCLTPVR